LKFYLKKISPSIFSWKKEYIKKLRCNSTVKIWFGRKKILNYACWILLFVSFSYTIRQCFCSPTIQFVPCAFFMTWQWTHSGKHLRMCEIVCWWRKHMAQIESWENKNIDGLYTKMKQKGGFISFVLGYLRMILWKISTAISIKHRILATFNMKQELSLKKRCTTKHKYYILLRTVFHWFVDEESTWHKLNRGRTKTLTDCIRKWNKKEDSASII
jgi:hypothetical protein